MDFSSTEQKDSTLDHKHPVVINCKTEYIEDKKNVCVDMFSCLPQRPSDSNDDNELSSPDIKYKMFEVSMINTSNINPETFLLNMTIR